MATELKLTASKYHTAARSKKRLPSVKEHELQVGVFKWAAVAKLKYPELHYMYAIPNGFPLIGVSPQTKARIVNYMKAEGLRPGALDICLPTPRFFIETVLHACYIEMKSVDGGVNDDQQEMADFLHEQGYFVAVCRSTKEAIDTLEKYLILPRP